MSRYFVYILSSRTVVLYTGATSNLEQRVLEHKSGRGSEFTARYRVSRLVYYEMTASSRAMVEREREIKGWSRQKKIELIESVNPSWKDLSETFQGSE